jgi:hypothetical protein
MPCPLLRKALQALQIMLLNFSLLNLFDSVPFYPR